MTIVEKDINEINPYINNPRKNDASVDAVAESIRQFGFKVPIVVDSSGVIVAGHTRYKAAQKLGILKLPCVVADDLTEEQIKAFRLADNKVGEASEWDFDKLGIELEGIKDIDMQAFGFIETLEESFDVQEDDYEEEVTKQPKSKPGQIYLLGEHRLMCGDSTKSEDVDRLMAGREADLVVTDPPYNVNVKNSKGMTIANDNLEENEFRLFLEKAFANIQSKLKLGGVLLCLACG